MSQKNKKKNQKLLVQIAFIVIPLFIVMFAAALYWMYTGSVKGFLEAQNNHMSEQLEKAANSGIFKTPAYFEYWENNIDLKEPSISDEDKRRADTYF